MLAHQQNHHEQIDWNEDWECSFNFGNVYELWTVCVCVVWHNENISAASLWCACVTHKKPSTEFDKPLQSNVRLHFDLNIKWKIFFFCLIFWINQIYLITFMDHSKISDPFRLCLCIIRIFFLIFYLILALHPHTYAFGTVTETHSPMRWDSFGTRMPCAEYAVLRLFFDWRSLLRGSSQSFGIGWMVWRRRRATIRLKKNKNLCVHPYVTVQSLVNASSKCISHTHPSATRARPCVCVRLPRVFIVFELYAMAWLFDTICRIRFTLLL